jgi:hypothetical protein
LPSADAAGAGSAAAVAAGASVAAGAAVAAGVPLDVLVPQATRLAAIRVESKTLATFFICFFLPYSPVFGLNIPVQTMVFEALPERLRTSESSGFYIWSCLFVGPFLLRQ